MHANYRPDRPDEDSEQHRVCFCMHVHEGTLRVAIRAGAHDLGALMDTTRAGRGCGTCRIDLLEILADERALRAEP